MKYRLSAALARMRGSLGAFGPIEYDIEAPNSGDAYAKFIRLYETSSGIALSQPDDDPEEYCPKCGGAWTCPKCGCKWEGGGDPDAAPARNGLHSDPILPTRKVMRWRDIVDRMTYLMGRRDSRQADDVELKELGGIQRLCDAHPKGLTEGWYSIAFIRHSHFLAYIRETMYAELPDGLVVDWHATADAQARNYDGIDYYGVRYLFRREGS